MVLNGNSPESPVCDAQTGWCICKCLNQQTQASHLSESPPASNPGPLRELDKPQLKEELLTGNAACVLSLSGCSSSNLCFKFVCRQRFLFTHMKMPKIGSAIISSSEGHFPKLLLFLSCLSLSLINSSLLLSQNRLLAHMSFTVKKSPLAACHQFLSPLPF